MGPWTFFIHLVMIHVHTDIFIKVHALLAEKLMMTMMMLKKVLTFGADPGISQSLLIHSAILQPSLVDNCSVVFVNSC